LVIRSKLSLLKASPRKAQKCPRERQEAGKT